jgi:hypothetical protein
MNVDAFNHNPMCIAKEDENFSLEIQDEKKKQNLTSLVLH